MSWQIIFSNLAEDELTEAYDWYEEQSTGLGFRLLSEVDKTIEKISEMPLAYSIKVKGYRSANVERFPYLILFEIIPEIRKVYILQIFHTSRYTEA